MNRCLLCFFLIGFAGMMACSSPEKENNSEEKKSNTTTSSEGTYDLSLRLNPGENFNWKVSWNDETVTQIPDEERGEGWNDVLDATGYTLVLESRPEEIKDNGDTKINADFTQVSSYYNGPEEQIAYDSQKPETEPQSMGYHYFLGKTIQYDLGKTGDIKNLTGGKEIFSQFGDPKLMEIGNEYASEILEVFIHLLPENPVKIGDSWKVTHTYSAATGIITDLTLTLAEVSEGLAQVEIVSRSRNNADAIPTQLRPNIAIWYDVAGDGNGTLTLNTSNGLPVHLIHSFHLTGHTLIGSPEEEDPPKYFTTKSFYYELQSL